MSTGIFRKDFLQSRHSQSDFAARSSLKFAQLFQKPDQLPAVLLAEVFMETPIPGQHPLIHTDGTLTSKLRDVYNNPAAVLRVLAAHDQLLFLQTTQDIRHPSGTDTELIRQCPGLSQIHIYDPKIHVPTHAVPSSS